MTEYIERDVAYELARDKYYSDFHKSMADLTSLKELLDDTPAADVVPRALFEQIQYERDLALQTLGEHGIGLGQIAKHSDAIYTDFMKGCEK